MIPILTIFFLAAVSALPRPTPTQIYAREQSLPASLTYASSNPAATTTRQANPNITSELLDAIVLAPTVGDRYDILYNHGPEYYKFDFLPGVSTQAESYGFFGSRKAVKPSWWIVRRSRW